MHKLLIPRYLASGMWGKLQEGGEILVAESGLRDGEKQKVSAEGTKPSSTNALLIEQTRSAASTGSIRHHPAQALDVIGWV